MSIEEPGFIGDYLKFYFGLLSPVSFKNSPAWKVMQPLELHTIDTRRQYFLLEESGEVDTNLLMET